MLLGDLIARLDDEATAIETLLATGDVALIARVQAAAAARQSTLGEALQAMIGEFCFNARPEDWIALMTAAARSDAPGAECLCVMLTTVLGRQEVAHGPSPAA
jgi:hypothetical protein